MEKQVTKQKDMAEVEVNPLRNEKIYVRFVPHVNGAASDPHHVLYGGLADGATITLNVPTLRSTGKYKNILTNSEKDYLEKALGLDFNALSVYNTNNNFWDEYEVKLTKDGLTLDLSIPDDYIKYKVILANSDIVAPSVQERIDRPKQTYRFEIVRAKEEEDIETAKMSATMKCYKEFGKIDDDIDTMRFLVESLDAHPYDATSSANFFRARINLLIQADPKKFLSYATDPLLHTKVILRRAVENGRAVKRADYYYQKDGTPMCENGETPTLSVAARYLNLPANQELKFYLENEIKEKE